MTAPVVFVTGATGALGIELVPRMLERKPDAEVCLLIRGADQSEVDARRDLLLDFVFGPSGHPELRRRVTALSGDLTRPHLGLDERTFGALAERTTHIVHSAASVEFDLPFEEAKAINLTGTERVFDLARAATRHHLERFVHVSTYAVCGGRKGLIREDELAAGQRLRNNYEQTKYLAEQRVRSLMGEVPTTIVRPSVIVGDSRTGRTRAFNHLYFFLKIAHLKLLPLVMPVSPRSRVDIVPVDFVADAIAHIQDVAWTESGTYHLTAGEGAVTVRRLAELTVAHLNAANPERALNRVHFMPQWFFRFVVRPLVWLSRNERMRRLYGTAMRYLPYVSNHRVFDTTQARRALEGTEIAVPPVESYFGTLVRYCLGTRWGRRPLEALPRPSGPVAAATS